jgi:hypothetical protein
LRGVPWFTDLTDALDQNGVDYLDTVHLNGRGNALIARRILDALQLDDGNSVILTEQSKRAMLIVPGIMSATSPQP